MLRSAIRVTVWLEKPGRTDSSVATALLPAANPTENSTQHCRTLSCRVPSFYSSSACEAAINCLPCRTLLSQGEQAGPYCVCLQIKHGAEQRPPLRRGWAPVSAGTTRIPINFRLQKKVKSFKSYNFAQTTFLKSNQNLSKHLLFVLVV